jgi:hypothetical protein
MIGLPEISREVFRNSRCQKDVAPHFRDPDNAGVCEPVPELALCRDYPANYKVPCTSCILLCKLQKPLPVRGRAQYSTLRKSPMGNTFTGMGRCEKAPAAVCRIFEHNVIACR